MQTQILKAGFKLTQATLTIRGNSVLANRSVYRKRVKRKTYNMLADLSVIHRDRTKFVVSGLKLCTESMKMRAQLSGPARQLPPCPCIGY
jgi:hypothetical protein